jgi:hypothetical protein
VIKYISPVTFTIIFKIYPNPQNFNEEKLPSQICIILRPDQMYFKSWMNMWLGWGRVWPGCKMGPGWVAEVERGWGSTLIHYVSVWSVIASININEKAGNYYFEKETFSLWAASPSYPERIYSFGFKLRVRWGSQALFRPWPHLLILQHTNFSNFYQHFNKD